MPDGTPGQVTFGVTQEEGIHFAPDGRSFVTSIGTSQSTVWVHDVRGDRQITSEGYVFNPVSFFFGYDTAGALVSVVAEVNNTYGGRHRYVLGPAERIGGSSRTGFRTPRELYVSPFLHGDRTYEWWFDAPLDAETLGITMHVDTPSSERIFTAHLGGQRRAMSDRTLALRPRHAETSVARSICPYCGVGCGQLVFHKDDEVVAIEGDRTYFDTNTSNHFHYYIEAEDRLFDIEATELSVNGLPDPPAGTKVARIDVIVRLRRDS